MTMNEQRAVRTLSHLRKVLFSYPVNVATITFIWAVLFAIIHSLLKVEPRFSTSLTFQFVLAIESISSVLFVFAIIAALVLFLRRNWMATGYYVFAACLLYASFVTSTWIRGDRFVFEAGPHQEIAKIYETSQLRMEDGPPRLIFLDEECHPPGGCYCWVLIDPSHGSGADADVGYWHDPKSSIFITKNGQMFFNIVNLRSINSTAYSVLGCTDDQRGFLPFVH
jgi:hypothetical protein